MNKYKVETTSGTHILDAIQMRVIDGDLTFWSEDKMIRAYCKGRWFEARIMEKEREK